MLPKSGSGIWPQAGKGWVATLWQDVQALLRMTLSSRIQAQKTVRYCVSTTT